METYEVTRGETELGRLWHEWSEKGEHTWGYSEDFDPAAKTRIERVIEDSDVFDREAGVLATDAPNPLISRSDAGWFGLLVVPALLREGYGLEEIDSNRGELTVQRDEDVVDHVRGPEDPLEDRQ